MEKIGNLLDRVTNGAPFKFWKIKVVKEMTEVDDSVLSYLQLK